MRYRVLVVLPTLASSRDATSFEQQLSFLTPYYDVDFLDPMGFDRAFYSSQDFYADIHHGLDAIQKKYHAFIGFSLGALCLLQGLHDTEKPLIILSAPTALSDTLEKKLRMSIENLSGKNHQQAYQIFMEWVHFPYQAHFISDIAFESCERLSRGLKHVCNWPFRKDYLQSDRRHWHFIGEESKLVTRQDVGKPAGCELVCVPDAGMRILENNPQNVQPQILEYLK